MTGDAPRRPLEGFTIVEMGNFIAGPYAGMMLADLGAEVIKVEEVKSGDPFRAWGKGLYSPAFRAFNRGKKSLTLDVRQERGKEVLLRLADKADALVENFRPGVMARLGADYETVSARNPRIVYCSLSGFGQSGPYRDRPSYDTVGQAMGGLLALLTDSDDPRPRGPGAGGLTHRPLRRVRRPVRADGARAHRRWSEGRDLADGVRRRVRRRDANVLRGAGDGVQRVDATEARAGVRVRYR